MAGALKNGLWKLARKSFDFIFCHQYVLIFKKEIVPCRN